MRWRILGQKEDTDNSGTLNEAWSSASICTLTTEPSGSYSSWLTKTPHIQNSQAMTTFWVLSLFSSCSSCVPLHMLQPCNPASSSTEPLQILSPSFPEVRMTQHSLSPCF